MHTERHPLAGREVTVTTAVPLGSPTPAHAVTAVLEDWWDRIAGGSWQLINTPVAAGYDLRRKHAGLPMDDEVVYVKAGGQGHLAHANEITPLGAVPVNGDS